MNNQAREFIFSTFQEAFEFMLPYLTNYAEFSKSLSREIQVKEGVNIQYNFDVELDRVFQKNIEKLDIQGKIFSEESGWKERGEKIFKIVYDPFCNSSLASRTFLDAATGLSIFNYENELITSAIMDYQTGIVGIVEDEKTNFYQIPSKAELKTNFTTKTKLEDSWVVITLENKKEREHIEKAGEILSRAKRIIINSGHIYWLRLATGAIDAYLDPFGGEKLYEIFACTVAQKSGAVVTDLQGEIFNPGKYLAIFEKNQDFIYYPVGAANEELHKEILKTIGLKKP